jgi:hypothetical protein
MLEFLMDAFRAAVMVYDFAFCIMTPENSFGMPPVLQANRG